MVLLSTTSEADDVVVDAELDVELDAELGAEPLVAGELESPLVLAAGDVMLPVGDCAALADGLPVAFPASAPEDRGWRSAKTAMAATTTPMTTMLIPATRSRR